MSHIRYPTAIYNLGNGDGMGIMLSSLVPGGAYGLTLLVERPAEENNVAVLTVKCPFGG